MIIQGDARVLPLADKSIDLVVTSPPYFGLRSYEDDGLKGYSGQIGLEKTPQEFVASLIECMQEIIRVTRPSGSIFINLGDVYASYPANRGDGRLQHNTHRPVFERGLSGGGAVGNKSLMLIPERFRIACVDKLGLVARAVIIWEKPNAMPAGRLRDRVRTVHEDWIHFTIRDRYFHNESALRGLGDGQMPPSVRRVNVTRTPMINGHKHCATFPLAWPRWFITGWCPLSGIVVDPFGGSGTTVLAAQELGRLGISIDLSGDYSRDAHDRTEHVKQSGWAV